MARILAACLALSLAAAPATAEPANPAIGRVDIAGPGPDEFSFCTGALIAPDLVLTAGHCIVDGPAGTLVDPARVTFRALRVGGAHVVARTATGLFTEPAFDLDDWQTDADGERRTDPLWSFSDDLALLRLAVPIAPDLIRPLPLAATPAHTGPVRISGYHGETGTDFTRYEGCMAINLSSKGMGLSCRVIPGTSGAPVLADTDTGPEIVAVASTIAEFSVWMQSFAPRATRPRIDTILAGH